MKDYILCMIFWSVFTVLLYGLGRAATRGKRSTAYTFVTGYLCYSIPMAAVGIVVQITGLPWSVFAISTAAIWAIILGYIIYVKKKYSTCVFYLNLRQHIKENWVLYVVLAILTGMMFFYYKGFWLGNHLDDGYYVTKVATLPYTQTGYSTNYPVGVANSGFDSYLLNTWELEASVYVKMLGVAPTLYLRLFQSIFYYLLFLNVVKGFTENIIQKLKIKVSESLYQVPVVFTLLFGMYYIFSNHTGLLPLRDTFHFNTGMFLGVTLPKMLGILLLLFYFVGAWKITLRMVLGVAGISLVLITRSTVALPVIAITIMSYLTVCLLFSKEKKCKVLGAATIGIYAAIAFVIPDSPSIQAILYSDALRSLTSPVVIISLGIFLCSFFLKEKVIVRINCVMAAAALLMLVPQVNDIFELCSVYRFVAGRAWTSWIYTLIMLSSVYLAIILIKVHVKECFVKTVYFVIGIALTAGITIGFDRYGGTLLFDEPLVDINIKNCLLVMRQNKYFVPQSTLLLSSELDELSKKVGEQLYVIAPEWVTVDTTMHGLAVSLRLNAPDIVSVSAARRYPVSNGSALSDYNQDVYALFASEPNEANSTALEEEMQKVGANCVVVLHDSCTEGLEELGYELYTVTSDNYYDIWYRKSGKE